MSEIQYCEDCKHIILAEDKPGDGKKRFASCGKSPKDQGSGFISRLFAKNAFYYCSTERDGSTCHKFEASHDNE